MKLLDSILLIEDDRITNYINERLLRRLNIASTIETAVNGLEALKVLNKKKEEGHPMPNLILLDINMPVMDGFEFLQKYQSLTADHKIKMETVIVMLTTSTHIRDMDKLLSSGTIDVLNKPLSQEKLLRVMNKYFCDALAQSA